ncbi:TolC family protein [Marinifilum sp. D737]|uniref:TolC family protein n=1 Tax=Marinifilum sp. D737 TaxID=2969628 RepID=UPI0022754E4F|nr:TolC family protein [Marinifilum sp. D737]MCY1633635.1 TolC family protein [Marinifilum sp. D737]
MKQLILLSFILLNATWINAQNTKEYSVAILGDEYIHETDSILNRLKAEIKSVVSQEATIVFKEKYFLMNQLSQKMAKENYQTVVNTDDVDLILSFGSLNNFVIAQNKTFPKPVILFGVINDDFIEFPEGQNTSQVKNLTYILTPKSYKKDLSEFKEMYPYKKVGIILDEYLSEIYPVKETLDKILGEIKSEYKLISISSADELDSQLEDIDAVYISGGLYFSKEERQRMIDMINNRNLPSFTSLDEEFSSLGVLLNTQPINELDQFFRRIALNIEAAVLGNDLSDLPIYLDVETKLLLNIETSFKINFPLKYSFLIKTNIIGNANKLSYKKKYYLDDFVYQLLEKNLSLKASKFDINLAQQEVKLANSQYLPNLTSSVTGSHIDPDLAKVSNGSNPEFTTSGNVNIEQLLFSEQASGNIKIQKTLAAASQENYNAIEKDAILDAGVTFYNALIAKANYLINDENLRVTRKNFEIAKQNYSAGQTGKGDVLRWKSELALATQNIVNAYTNFIQAMHAINQLLNNPINYKIDIKHSLVDENTEDQFNYKGLIALIDDPILRSKLLKYLETVAIENAHELKSLQFNIEASERSAKLYQRSKFIPSIALQGGYNYTFSRDGKGSTYPTGIVGAPDGYYNVGVQLSLPIFNQNQRSLNRQKSLIQQQQLNIQKENTETLIKKNVNDIVFTILNLYTNIELSKLTTKTAKESLELMQISYSNGAIGITSLIDAQQAYFQAQQQQASAGYNFYLSLLQMERVLSYYFFLNPDEENQTFIQNLQTYLLTNN